jgi:MSHA type pilus biogenesis protein MshL
MLGLRYQYKNKVLVIARDDPYIKNYPIHFLTLKRESENRISIATDVFAGQAEGHASKADNGSHTVVTAKAESDFWGELENILGSILAQTKSPHQNQNAEEASFSVHKQAGLLTVKASRRQHQLIEQYLTKLKRATNSQVLIEAKVVEVTLQDQYKNGINWRGMFKGDLLFAAPLGDLVKAPPYQQINSATQDMVTFGAEGNDMSTIFNFVKSFGTIRTLSSPRLTVMNNHPAILKVAENQVYFRIKYDQQIVPDAANSRTYTTLVSSQSEIQTVPIGLVMSVQPSIDFETDEVIMTLRPTITRVTTTKEDPAVSIASSNTVKSLIPVVEVREMDSILRVHSGGIVVMGGLMQERAKSDEKGIPGASDIPILGSLFKAEEDTQQVSEVVIILQATVLDAPETSVHAADKRVYQDFTSDPRPLSLEKMEEGQ